RLSVHARSTVFARAPVRLGQPMKIQVVVERGEPHLRRLLRQFRYPLLFRGHSVRFRCTGHVSLQRFRSPAPPSLHRVPTGTVPRLPRYYGALRFPANRHDQLPCRSPAVTTPLRLFSSLPSGPTPAWGQGYADAATPTPPCGWSRRASQVPGEPSCAYAMFSDPGGTRATRPYGAPTRPPEMAKPRATRG